MTDILEIFGESTLDNVDWRSLVERQGCPFLNGKCIKVRKSEPDISIGTCSVSYSRSKQPVVICPLRLLEKRKIFVDSLHLLLSHEPGNELHIVPEVSVPGGSVDYFLVSVRSSKVVDFVGIELQTIDTTGTVWPTRQRFLSDVGAADIKEERGLDRAYGMNWKMTAKTTLVQLHHKIQTFESMNRHLILVTQDVLLDYLEKNFEFGHVSDAKRGDSMQFHAYKFGQQGGKYSIRLVSRLSTDSEGVGTCLGLKAEPKVEFGRIVALIEKKLSSGTLFEIC